MLPQPFYARPARPARTVAQELLGKKLVRQQNGRILSGIIVETEAYCDANIPDLACHGDRANNGQPTPRTQIMFGPAGPAGPAGFAYVYFTYGIHWLFNVVTGQEGEANAVLIRALEPVDGVEIMSLNRPKRPLSQLTNGPAKLTQALNIDKSHNGANLCQPHGVIWVEEQPSILATSIASGPRIGLGKTPEPWYSIPWRYWIKNNAYVSKQT